jgi:hypothetical protein
MTMLSKKLIRSDMRKLMKCMNHALHKAENTNHDCSKLYYNMYQLLGAYAWGYIADHCEHDYRVSKKYPMGRCRDCGTIRRQNENKKRVRK